MQNREAYVRLERENIDTNAELHVTSSDATKVSILDPADGRVPSGAHADLKIKALVGGNPAEAHIEVHFGSATGPILSRLLVRCFTRRRVAITPHIVTIHNAAGTGGVASTANVAAIMDHVQAIWRHSGVEFTIGAAVNDSINLATANVLSDTPFPGEIVTVLGTNWVANTINVYFVSQIGTGSTLGYGFSRPSSVAFGTGNPGIILGDRTAGGVVHDTPWAAMTSRTRRGISSGSGTRTTSSLPTNARTRGRGECSCTTTTGRPSRATGRMIADMACSVAAHAAVVSSRISTSRASRRTMRRTPREVRSWLVPTD